MLPCQKKTQKTRNQSRLNKPWLSSALISLLRRKIDFIKNFSEIQQWIVNQFRKVIKTNEIDHSLQIAKRLYYEKKLNNVQSNARATWNLFNEILNRSKRNSNRFSTFEANDREITDPVEIADTFCSYFLSIGPNLVRGIQSSTSASHSTFLNGSFTQLIFFNPTTQDEIAEIVKTLRSWL